MPTPFHGQPSRSRVADHIEARTAVLDALYVQGALDAAGALGVAMVWSVLGADPASEAGDLVGAALRHADDLGLLRLSGSQVWLTREGIAVVEGRCGA